MVEGLIGTKVGMTQTFAEDGKIVPVTILLAGPCVVVQRKTVEKDGYEAVQLGLVNAKAAKRATKPVQGHHRKAGVPPTRVRREFPLEPGSQLKEGDPVGVDIFDGVSAVDIIGTSKGKGFQGVVRRHSFRGGRATHGSMFHRAPGSIGQSADPSRVFPGSRGPGHMGARRTTAKNVKVVRIDSEKNLLVVQGSVPGASGSRVLIWKSKAPRSGAKS
jgi:large subunit ribosomal protein L3